MKTLRFVFLTLFMTSLFFTISLLFLSEIAVYSKQNNFIEKLECQYIVTYEGTINTQNEFKLLNNIYSIYDKNNMIKADILMQSENDNIFGEQCLNANEVVVSKNFLNNGYHVGDLIIVKSPLNDEKLYFKIIGVIECCYGISNENIDKNKSLVIFGHNEEISNLATYNIAFINNEKISNNSVKLSKLIQVDNIVEYNYSKMLPLIILEIGIKSLICIIYFFLFIVLFKYIIRRLIINGRKELNILTSTYIKYCLPLLMSVFLSIAVTIVYSITYLSYMPIFVIMFSISFIILLVMMIMDLKIKMRRN